MTTVVALVLVEPPPALFLPDAKTAERLLEFFTARMSVTRTRGGRTSMRHAGSRAGARTGGCERSRR
jgi:hypothetical protein